MTKMKKIAAGILAAVSMATCVAGMSASAYSPTITRTVGSVTGTLYSDTTYGYGTTERSGVVCWVKVQHAGITTDWMKSYGYASCKNSNNNGSTNATSWHRTDTSPSFTIVF